MRILIFLIIGVVVSLILIGFRAELQCAFSKQCVNPLINESTRIERGMKPLGAIRQDCNCICAESQSFLNPNFGTAGDHYYAKEIGVEDGAQSWEEDVFKFENGNNEIYLARGLNFENHPEFYFRETLVFEDKVKHQLSISQQEFEQKLKELIGKE